MPIPDLNEDGLLPEGIHEASLEEVRERFGRFQRTDRRPELFSKLALFLTEVRACGLVEAVIVDGSFVTAKDEPSDIDLILVLRSDRRTGLNSGRSSIMHCRSVECVVGSASTS